MGRKPQLDAQGRAPWTEADQYILHTVERLWARVTGRTDAAPPILTTFPPVFDRAEAMQAQSEYQLFEFGALGDGSYTKSTFFLGGTGVLGLTMGAATLAGSAIGNASRRAAAQAAATPQWHVVDGGVLTMSTHGFYLAGQQGLLPWSWSAITSASMVERSAVHLNGQSEGGPISWIIRSPMSELLFVMWAVAIHRPPPTDGRWMAAAGLGRTRQVPRCLAGGTDHGDRPGLAALTRTGAGRSILDATVYSLFTADADRGSRGDQPDRHLIRRKPVMATITFTTLRCLRQQDVTGKDEPVLFFEGDRIWNGVVDKKQTVRVDRTRAFDGSVTVTLKEENPRSLKTLGSVTIRRGDRGPAVFKTSGAHYELQYSITASTRGQMP